MATLLSRARPITHGSCCFVARSQRLNVLRTAARRSSERQAPAPADAMLLWARSLLHSPLQSGSMSDAKLAGQHIVQTPTLMLAAALLLTAAVAASPAHASAAADSVQATIQHPHAANSLADLSEEQEFWSNVARYGRYFITVMLGTGAHMGFRCEPVVSRVQTLSPAWQSSSCTHCLHASCSQGFDRPLITACWSHCVSERHAFCSLLLQFIVCLLSDAQGRCYFQPHDPVKHLLHHGISPQRHLRKRFCRNAFNCLQAPALAFSLRVLLYAHTAELGMSYSPEVVFSFPTNC